MEVEDELTMVIEMIVREEKRRFLEELRLIVEIAAGQAVEEVETAREAAAEAEAKAAAEAEAKALAEA